MTQGDEAHELSAASAVGNEQETTTYRLTLSNPTLEPGEHVLTISLHNHGKQSSDLRIGGISLLEVSPPKP